MYVCIGNYGKSFISLVTGKISLSYLHRAVVQEISYDTHNSNIIDHLTFPPLWEELYFLFLLYRGKNSFIDLFIEAKIMNERLRPITKGVRVWNENQQNCKRIAIFGNNYEYLDGDTRYEYITNYFINIENTPISFRHEINMSEYWK